MFQMNLIKKLKTSYELKLSPDKKFLCHNNSKTIVYDVNSFKEVIVLNKPSDPGRIRFSPNSEYLLIKKTTGGIWVYKTDNFQLVKVLKSNKSFKFLERDFTFTQDNETILDTLQINQEEQIVAININSGEKIILTELKYKDSIISHNHYSKKGNFHLFTLDYVNEKGYRVNKMIKVKEPINKQSIEVISNEEILYWESIIFNSVANAYILVINYEIILVDSSFKNVLKKVTIVDHECQEATGYFYHIYLSTNGKFIALTYSNRIFILRFEDLETIFIEDVPYACFAEFSNDDQYLFIGTWENGYVFENNL
ncbi:hypothetical protein [Chengkuizengella sediminis]|uniref:hypothetical protein n=1 Tax=Chengkuizengella sediminis TaxID=1885917 RepID=UPI00138970C3|nr:hypothetical protein [Chengkuizengella sediminis]NDI34828.1 hypothetical protein [Chengkuizengella sediminis]